MSDRKEPTISWATLPKGPRKPRALAGAWIPLRLRDQRGTSEHRRNSAMAQQQPPSYKSAHERIACPLSGCT